MYFLRVVGIILEVVILFNFIILIHELGHFLAARWRGLKIEKFQIWFGKPLWSKTINGVQYGLGWIPAGGFVALPQMAPMEALEGSTEDRAALPAIKPLDKIIVAAAGPIFSFGLAIVFAMVVWKIGYPVSQSQASTTIGAISPDAPNGAELLEPGDKILEIDGRVVNTWSGMVDSVLWNVVSSEGDQIPVKVDRDGEILTVNIDAPEIPEEPQTEADGAVAKAQQWVGKIFARPGFRDVGLYASYSPMVGEVYPNSPAKVAGIQPNDVITGLNGNPLLHPSEIGEFIESNRGEPFQLDLERFDPGTGKWYPLGEPVTLTPRVPDNWADVAQVRIAAQSAAFLVANTGAPVAYRPVSAILAAPPKALLPQELIGVIWDETGRSTLKYPTPVDQIQQGVRTMVNTLSAVFSPSSSISAKHLSGPVMIMRIYYILFEDENGWRRAFWFTVVLNINLAILNMLPLPVLDGGHITMAIIEWIRRKPISVRVLEFVQVSCALFLIGFMLFITGVDLRDLFGGGQRGENLNVPVFREQGASGD